ncbi:DUF4190 domain-containing protein [Streptomyces sp. NA04227]|uniref:DUF4190 domain-containing protein n=1 Tax=Streptomyces sp. NA04227 TaxID=2742136 RepID=UPI0015900D03|nr:DUF4190 domain-containing protein [Streptomyces sp. NA04227]QKW09480.1 DUF4190 domain-containing protein [Streptomyces sp. NA04227]
MAVDPQQPGMRGSAEGPEYLDTSAPAPVPAAEPQDAPPPGYGAGYTEPGIPTDAIPGAGAVAEPEDPVGGGPLTDSVGGGDDARSADPPDDTSVHSQPTLTALPIDGQLLSGGGQLPGHSGSGSPGSTGHTPPPGQQSGAPASGTHAVPAAHLAHGTHTGPGTSGNSGWAAPAYPSTGGYGSGQFAPVTSGHAAAQPPIAPGGPGPAAPPLGGPFPGAPAGYGYPAAGPGQVPYGPGQVPYGAYATPYPPSPYHWHGPLPAPPSDGMGTASLVTGLLSVLGFCLWPVSILLGICAVVFGVVQRGKVRRGEATNGGHALAGIICGSVGASLALIFLILLISSGSLV